MAERTRTLSLAAVNITTHPHSAESYIDLLQRAYRLKKPVQVRGDTYGVLGSHYELDGVITGEIFTFLELDSNLDWFNLEEGEEATDVQKSEVRIPENLRPHLKKFRFVFFPKTHLFVFTKRYGHIISPRSVATFLRSLLNDRRLLDRAPYQEVEVTLVQDKQEVMAAFDSFMVQKLEIHIKRPNGDTPDDIDVEEEFADQNIMDYRISAQAERGKPIIPDKRTKKYIEEAVTNGDVRVSGTDDQNRPQSFSSIDKPLEESFKYDPRQPFLEFVIDAARGMVGRIRGQ